MAKSLLHENFGLLKQGKSSMFDVGLDSSVNPSPPMCMPCLFASLISARVIGVRHGPAVLRVLLLGLFLCWVHQTKAQVVRADSLAKPAVSGPHPRHNVIKINPLSLAVGSFSLFYEHSLTSRLSVVVGYGSAGRDFGFSNQIDNGKYNLRRGTVELRRYWSRGKGPLSGLYAGPYLRAGALQESRHVDDPPGQHITGRWQTNTAFVWAPGVMGGYQLVARWVAIDAFVGLQAQIVSGNLAGSNEVVQGLTSAVAPRVGLTVGIPF